VISETLRKLEEDQRTAFFALSSGLLSIRAAEKLLTDICPTAPTNSGLQNSLNLVSSARKWLMSSANRMLVGLSTSILLRKDNAVTQIDKLVPASTNESLRTAPLLAPSLFGEKADTELQQARFQHKPTHAIKEMVHSTKSLVKKPNQQTANKPGNKRPAQAKASHFTAAPMASTVTAPAANHSSSVPPSPPPHTKRRRFRGPRNRRGNSDITVVAFIVYQPSPIIDSSCGGVQI
jgi:hypothetical protein